MSTVTFDTLKFVERLEKAGASRELASALVEVQKESLSEVIAIKGVSIELNSPSPLALSPPGV